MEELKNCPFCGGKAEILDADDIRNVGYISSGSKYKVMCENCCCGTGIYGHTPMLAIEAWNRRVTDES